MRSKIYPAYSYYTDKKDCNTSSNKGKLHVLRDSKNKIRKHSVKYKRIHRVAWGKAVWVLLDKRQKVWPDALKYFFQKQIDDNAGIENGWKK